MTYAEKRAMIYLVEAHKHMQELRTAFCGAFQSLPRDHPWYSELEARFFALYPDTQPTPTRGDGLYYDFLDIASRLDKSPPKEPK